MPKVGTKIQEGADDVQLNVPYKIVTAEDVKTEKAQYTGIRLGLEDKKGDEGSVMLWSRPITSPYSKLGAVITLLGDNTDNWLSKWVIFKSWSQGERDIQLVK